MRKSKSIKISLRVTRKKKAKPKSTENLKRNTKKVIRAILAGERVFSSDKSAFDLYSQSHFGEPIDGKIYYSLVEALYLIELKKLVVYEKKRKFTYETFIERARDLETNFWTRYRVFRDMRNRGYITKTALKFGADFRVYERGTKPGQAHAKWILYPVSESSSLTWHEFAAKNRVAHSTKKHLLVAIVDDEGDITYYQISWVRP